MLAVQQASLPHAPSILQHTLTSSGGVLGGSIPLTASAIAACGDSALLPRLLPLPLPPTPLL
eukprot:scaffold21781_cov20-Tisochrysis_lutea.AAC.1